MIDLPKANLFIIYTKPFEGHYKEFAPILEKIISSVEYIET